MLALSSRDRALLDESGKSAATEEIGRCSKEMTQQFILRGRDSLHRRDRHWNACWFSRDEDTLNRKERVMRSARVVFRLYCKQRIEPRARRLDRRVGKTNWEMTNASAYALLPHIYEVSRGAPLRLSDLFFRCRWV